MCKIMIIPGVKPEYSAKAERLAKAAKPYLTKTDDDAFGYAALSDGGIFGEKWTAVNEAFRDQSMRKQAYSRLESLFGTAVKMPGREGEYHSFGARSGNVYAWILHARWATVGAKAVKNAHPFIRDGHALIHNGTISNHSVLRKITSECDSETILNAYVDAGVAKHLDKIDRVSMVLEGWYACGVLAPTPQGYVIDVFRDGTASLVCGYVPEIDAAVFCTTAEILKSACRAANMRVFNILTVPARTVYRLNAYTGEKISEHAFTPRGNIRQYAGYSAWERGYLDAAIAQTAERAAGWNKTGAAHADPIASQWDADTQAEINARLAKATKRERRKIKARLKRFSGTAEYADLVRDAATRIKT